MALDFGFLVPVIAASEAASSFEEISTAGETTIEIGMTLAKVGIEREWYNPGVFALTKDMFNVTTSKIAPNSKEYTEFDDARFKEMAACVFPCYPVAMLIAQDISIKVTSSSSSFEAFSSATEKHSSTGGGFLFFSGSKASSSSSSFSSTHTQAHGNSITIRFDTP